MSRSKFYTCLSMNMECGYLNGWIKKTVTYAKISPKMVNPRDRAGEHRQRRIYLSVGQPVETSFQVNHVPIKVIYLSVGQPVETSSQANHVKVKVIYLSVGQQVETSFQVNHVKVKVIYLSVGQPVETSSGESCQCQSYIPVYPLRWNVTTSMVGL